MRGYRAQERRGGGGRKIRQKVRISPKLRGDLKQGTREGREREARKKARMMQVLRMKTHMRLNDGHEEGVTAKQAHEISRSRWHANSCEACGG